MEFLQQIHRYVAFSIYYGRRKNAFSCRLRNSRDKTTLEIGGLGPTNGNRDGNKRTYDHLQFAITFGLCAILHTLRMNVSFVVFFYVSFVVMGRSGGSGQTQNVSFILMIELSSHIL